MEAAAAVPRLEASELCTSGAVEAGTAMVAVTVTLPAVTAMVTADGSTRARRAMAARREVVSS